jgi:C4-dicarboxylate transporter DctQ subunit
LDRQQNMMNEVAATLPLPMWIIGLVMPVSSVVAILAIIDSLQTRRDLIALPEPGLPPGELVHADVNMTGSSQP